MNINTLVFSQNKSIRCSHYIDQDHIMIGNDEELIILNIGVKNYIDKYQEVKYSINIFKYQQNIFLIQNKMGYMYVFCINDYHFNFLNSFKINTIGFLKVIPYCLNINSENKRCIWVVDTQQLLLLQCYDIMKGEKIYQFMFQEENHAKGITYILIFFFAQQGCTIYKYKIKKYSLGNEKMEFQDKIQLSHQTKQEVKIIYNLCFDKNTQNLYVIIRNQPYVYVIGDMKIKNKIKLQNGIRIIQITLKGLTIFGKGKILGIDGQTYAKVSKDYINSVSVNKKVIMGTTQGSEYFYHQLI